MEIKKHVLGFVCYWLGIDWLFYKLNRRAKRVVTFHNVLPDSVGSGMRDLPVVQLSSQFQWMVHEAVRFLKTDVDLNAEGTLTITFDDGYLNQFEVAPQALAAEGVDAAVIFVSDDVIQANGSPSTSIGVEAAWH